MKKAAIIIGIIVVVIIIIAVATCGEPSTPVATPTPPSTSSPTPTSTPTPTPTTFSPITLTGSSDKTTPPFSVTTKEWIIDWSYVPDPEYPEYAAFSFFIYPRGETAMYVEAMLSSEGTSGSTYSYAGPGEYYIKVNCANLKSWEITINPA